MTIKNSARLLINAVVAISLCGLVLSCGGGGDSDSGGASGESGTITITTDLTSIPADGSTSTVIHALIKDSAGNPVRHYTEVVFTTNLGHFRNGGTRYTMQTQPPLDAEGWPDPDAAPTGIAEVQFIAGTTPGSAKITVSSNGVTNSIYVTLKGGTGAIVLTASPVTFPADGSSSSIITATITDASGNPVTPGTVVKFETGLGYFPNGEKTYSIQTSDDTGILTISLQAGLVPGRTYLSAISNGASQSLSLILLRDGRSVMNLLADPSSIPADGVSKSLVTATVTDLSGKPIKDVPVTFYDVTGGEPNPEPAPDTYTGTGKKVTDPPFYTNGGLMTFTMSHTGNSNFIIWLWNDDTQSREDLIENEIGPVTDDQTIVSLAKGNYFFQVDADGDWEIKIDGDITPAPTSLDAVVLAINKTDANGVAQYVYTSTITTEIIKIKAETGEVTNTEESLNQTISITQTGLGPAEIELEAQPVEIYANGKNQTTILATVKDKNGNKVADNTTVNFSTTLGVFSNSTDAITAETEGGIATATLTSVASATNVTALVTATTGTITPATTTVTFKGSLMTNMQATPPAIFANGTDKSTITVRLVDSTGVAIAGETIVFSTTGGTITTAAAVTNAEGVATAELTAPTTPGTATITATYGTITTTAGISFESIGSGSITLTTNPTSIPADGASSSIITATIKYSSGEAVPKGTSVTFTTSLGTFSNGTESYTVITPDDTGIVSVSLIAGTTAGSAKITVSAIGISQTIYIAIGGTAASITVAANPESIPADGGSSSTITATLKDSSGAAVTAGTPVTFTTTLGTFSNNLQTITVDTPDGTGIVSVSLIAASTPGTATVTAASNGVSANTYVSMGGAAGSVTLTANPSSMPADGTSSSLISATLKDSSGAPVTPGTAVTFMTSLGTFQNGTQTYTINTPDATGIVSVSLISSTTAGTATVSASANGVSGTTYVVIGGTVGSITLEADPTSILADGASSSAITATVKDAAGNPVNAGTSVVFTTNLGTFSNGTATITVITSGATGVATASLIAGTTPGTATVTVESNGVKQAITVTFSGPPANITATATPSTLAADGTSTSSVKATVLDSNGNPVADGETLTVTVVSGTVSLLNPTTTNGLATITYTAPSSVPQGNNDTVTFTATNGVAGDVDISLTGPEVATVVLSATPANLPADGTSTATITATVTVSGGGSAPENTPVDFTVTGGGTFQSSGTTTVTKNTNASGVATAKLVAGTSSATATISATSTGVSASPISVSYQPGSIVLTIIPNSVLATGGATAEVTAALKDVNGNPAADGQTVNFSLDDTSLGSIPATGTTSGGQGEAKVTFTAGSKGGTVTITATWTTGGTNVTGEGEVSIQSPPAFIEIAEGFPDPQKINIKGTGGQSTSQLKFNVKDVEGNLVVGGYRIDFTIVTGPNGGESLIPASTSTANGQASTLLYSGLKSGPVSIKATYHDNATINTTASQIVIVGGPAVGEEFGISAAYLNVSGLWKANLMDAMGINAADLYGNAIADNTAISFKTYNTGGFFETGTGVTTNGVASDNLVSGGTYLTPLNGFVSTTAEVVGGNTTRVSALAVSPSPDTNIIYAGTNGGGVYKSTDSGATWTNITRSSENPKQGQNWLDPYIKGHSAISVDPDDANTVYVGTGYLGKGALYRSLDGGNNWNSNDLEQWSGLYTTKSAVLTVLCDDGSTYVWFGTEGEGFYLSADGETFVGATTGLTYGTTVNEVIKVPGTSGTTADLYAATPNGVYFSTNAGVNWTATGGFTNDIINAIAIHPTSTNVLYVGTDSVGVWVSSNSGANWTQYYPLGMGKGLSASVPVPDVNNTGNGSMSDVTVADITKAEFWAVTCTTAATDSGTFKVEGSVSGLMATTATVGTAYTSPSGEVAFTISDGTVDFAVGDNFTFTTSRDPGSNIKDLFVDSGNNKLYAITYYFGPLEPYHAVGNVYAHGLEAGGTMSAGDWTEANTGLPQYSPPNDTTLFAQHVMAANDPTNPAWFLIGGEGINLYKATTGFATAAPDWKTSKTGFSNLIMARMPVLFSGNCTMSIDETDLGSNVYRYTVYIEDKNGNPPISDSEFAVTTWDAVGGFINTVRRVVYADVYVHEGTFSDPSDATTNTPYVIDIDYSGLVAEAKFLFTPKCAAEAPGCSGSEQESTYRHPAITTPSVTTTTTTALTATTASSGGNVTNDGGSAVTARGVCWNTTGNPDIYDSTTSDGTGTGTFPSSITGLTTGTTYYVRAYATNSVGTGYGSQRIITTP